MSPTGNLLGDGAVLALGVYGSAVVVLLVVAAGMAYVVARREGR